MKVTICDPNTFESKEIEVDVLQNNLADSIRDALPNIIAGIPMLKTITQLVYNEEGKIMMGLLFRDGLGQDEARSKKFRITVERIEE